VWAIAVDNIIENSLHHNHLAPVLADVIAVICSLASSRPLKISLNIRSDFEEEGIRSDPKAPSEFGLKEPDRGSVVERAALSMIRSKHGREIPGMGHEALVILGLKKCEAGLEIGENAPMRLR